MLLSATGLACALAGDASAVVDGISAEDGVGGRRGVLVQAALNGGTTRAEHAAVPLTPDELADEARAAADNGAQALHLHPRDASGAQTLEPDHVLAAVAATRAATGLPVGVTTGIWTVDGDVARRLDLVARWTGPDRPDYASINLNEPGTEALADLLTSLGIGIEAGVWTAADARLLGAAGFRSRILRVLMEPDRPRSRRLPSRPPPRPPRNSPDSASRPVRCTTVTTSPPGT